MIWLAIGLVVLLSGAFISWAVVPLVAGGPVQVALGPVRAGALGVAVCAGVAVAGFWLWNPDRLAALARLKESAMLAAFAASFWLPWFLWSYGRRRDRAK